LVGRTESDGRVRSQLGVAYRGGGFVYVGRIGTGFSASTVSRLLPRLTQ
jgi:bifunctional non-homologous end joining protein LigD